MRNSKGSGRMKGVRIFMHSLYQVTGNLEGALRVSLLPYAIQIVASLVFAGRIESLGDLGVVGGGGLGVFLTLAVVIATSLWIAVAWHRFVLLNERPAGMVPAFHGPLVWAYFLRSLGYAAIIVAGVLVLGSIVMLLFGGLLRGSTALVMVVSGLLVYLPLTVVMLRLMTALPGVALGAEGAFLAGMRATEGRTGEIAVVAVIVVGLRIVLAFLSLKLLANLTILGFAWDAVTGWFVTMVGVSILTTLYGHYVEGRPLRD